MTSRGNAKSVSLGPGYLFAAILGTEKPALTPDGATSTLGAVWAAAWTPLGYTDAGTTQSYAPSYDPVEVAEEVDAIDSIATGREITVSFDAAQNTASNYKLAMNGGTVVVTGTSPNQYTEFTPPALGEETQTMLGWESEKHDEVWVWYQCKQTGSVETARTKGADKALIPMQFTVYKPSDLPPFWRASIRDGEPIA